MYSFETYLATTEPERRAYITGALEMAEALGYHCPFSSGEPNLQATWIMGELIRAQAETEQRARENARLVIAKYGIDKQQLRARAETERRAREVAHLIVERYGIDKQRLHAQ